MKTALLLTTATDARQFFTEALGPHFNLVLLEPPAEPDRARFDALFETWLRLVDTVLVDAVSLGESTRWALESLAGARLAEHQTVVVRLTANQRDNYQLEPDWLSIAATGDQEQLRHSLLTFLELREAQCKLKRANAALGRQSAKTGGDSHSTGTPLVPAADLLRYRDALRNIGQVLGKNLNEHELLTEFLNFVRGLLGVGKLALFTRQYHNDLFTDRLTLEDRQLTIASSHGIAPNVVEHLRLNLDFGIAGRLSREAKLLRFAAQADALAPNHDPQIAREFDLLGAEVAVPMFDNDQLLGALAFSGKVTGEPLVNEELELVYHLLAQLAQAIRNLHLQAKLVGQQRFMGEVLAHAQSAVIVVGQDDRILCANRRARRLLELGEGELVGHRSNCLPPCVGDVLFQVLQTGEEIRQHEVHLPRNHRPLSVSATRFSMSLGDAEGLVAVALVEDLTEAKLQQAHERELADKEFFTRLAARLSHELKNSLVSIKIYAQLLPERYDDPEFRTQFRGIVSSEVNRVDLLVQNLTFFTRPLVLVYEEVRTDELLDTCFRRLTTEFSQKRLLQVNLAGQKTPPSETDLPVVTLRKNFDIPSQIEGDVIRLEQAFEHILRNALQSLPQGGRLTVSATGAGPADFPDGQLPAGGALRLDWQDTGEGIALDQLPHIAEPFITTRNVGVGLGLTIVKRIVERHGGRLTVDSTLGVGTKVTVILPRKSQPHPEDHIIEEATIRTVAQAPVMTPAPAVSQL